MGPEGGDMRTGLGKQEVSEVPTWWSGRLVHGLRVEAPGCGGSEHGMQAGVTQPGPVRCPETTRPATCLSSIPLDPEADRP